jgi:malonyl CoA-acyl carrier protein transacylase
MKVGLFPGQGVQPSIVLETLSSRHKLLKRADEILEMDLRRRVEIAARGSAAALPTWLAQPAIFVSSMIGWEAAQPSELQFFAGRGCRFRSGPANGQVPRAGDARCQQT